MATRTFDSIDITGKHEPLTVPSNGTIQDLIDEARRKHKVPVTAEFRLGVRGTGLSFKSDDKSVASRKLSDWDVFRNGDPTIYIMMILRGVPIEQYENRINVNKAKTALTEYFDNPQRRIRGAEMRNRSIEAKSGVLRGCRAKYAARGGKSRKHRKSRRKTRRGSRR